MNCEVEMNYPLTLLNYDDIYTHVQCTSLMFS